MHESASCLPRTLKDIVSAGLPDELSGQAGSNRDYDFEPLIPAQTDSQAIAAWLGESPDGSATRRAYEKEVQRLYAWALAYAGKPISSLTRGDMDAYELFMSAPPLHWCAPRYVRRDSAEWRPFEGPVSSDSRRHALRVLKAFFAYLVGVHYLVRNPLGAAQARRGGSSSGPLTQLRYIPRGLLTRLLAALEDECARLKASGEAHLEMERMLMVIRVLANTGLRRGELASAVMGDLYADRDAVTGAEHWFLALNKRERSSEVVAFNPTALAAVFRCLSANGVNPYKVDPRTPLVPKLDCYAVIDEPYSATTEQTIYNIVQKALSIGAKALENTNPNDAHVLRRATPYWFRRTFVTLMTEIGQPLPLINRQLRHASINTTAGYVRAENYELYRAAASLAV
ncbi:tyrosine-type recombinase/integrase [Ralstonia edaphi]|nr:site-specific integrase [Ralstonia sp. LMG 6871]